LNIKLRLKLISIVILFIASIFTVLKIPLNLGLDLQGGSRIILNCQDTESRKVDDKAVQGAVEIIRNRIDALGISEPIIQRKGQRQIIVEMPGIKDPERAINLIGETALLEFVRGESLVASKELLLTENRIEKLYGKKARLETYAVYNNKGEKVGEQQIILKETVLTGSDLKTVNLRHDTYGVPYVSIEFTSQAADIFYKTTNQDVGKPLAIVLDGVIISAPNINEPIPGGKASISGKFTLQEATDLVIKLNAGSLPVPVEIISNQTIGPSLGKSSIEKSKKAGLWGLLAVAIFMILYYRLPGLIAAIALFFYAILVLTVFVLGNFTLTLPGLAGFIITFGMAVDANILIFERLKEELRNNKILKVAIDTAFNRAFLTILDANITTAIAVLPLLWLGTGTIKGFAVIMLIGIVASMFSALIITRILIEVIATSSILKSNTKLILQ